MAGDWIKIESVTPDKPEVIGIAEALGIDQDAVVGKLIRIWIWADQQTFDGNAGGNARGVTKTFIDRCTCVIGFGAAMEGVGWLTIDPEGRLAFPHFDRHNGQTAKQRALTAKRVARLKAKGNAKGNAVGVTEALPREEKRREEKRRDKKEEEDSSELPSTAASEPPDSPLPSFPCVGKGAAEWHLSAAKLREYREAFPGVDVLVEARKALQWCRDNPTKRKTCKGMPAFIQRWLSKAQDHGGGTGGRSVYESPPLPTLDAESIEKYR